MEPPLRPPPTTVAELEALWREVREGGEGEVVRLCGAGGRALAAAFATRVPPRAQLGAGDLPDDSPTFVWFDGPGAALAAADRCALFVAYHGAPWLVVATGPDAHTVGPPTIGPTLRPDFSGPDISGPDVGPTRVDDPLAGLDTAALAAVAERAIDDGDPCTAAVAAHHLVARDPSSRVRWGFVEVFRLVRLCRRDDAFARAATLADLCERGPMLAEIARLDHLLGEAERADQLAELSNTPYGDWVRVVVRANYGRGRWDDVVPPRRADAAAIPIAQTMVAGRHPEELEYPDFPYARALQLEYGRRDAGGMFEAIQIYCRLGVADDAWRASAMLFEGSDRASRVIRHAIRPITRTVMAARTALEERRPREVLALLDAIESRLAPLAGVSVGQAAIIRAAACALLDDKPGFNAALTRVREGGVGPGWADDVVQNVGHDLPGWAAARFVDFGLPVAVPLAERPVILGEFEAHAPIGAGAMGEVWRGQHSALGTPVAIKLVPAALAGEASTFDAEIEAVSRLDHPAIVQVLDVGRVGRAAEAQTGGALVAGTPFLAMELASDTLASYCGKVGWSEVRDILLALLDALAYAHARGIVHRDIKPENILCMSTPSGTTVRLSDFGLVGLHRDKPVGTPAYMAPELWSRRAATSASDVYAVGCLAVHLLTGMPPFLGSLEGLMRAHVSRAPSLDFDEIPPGARAWIAQLLAKSPHDRPTVQQARAGLLATIDGDGPVRGAARRVPTRSSGTTFALETLLGLPTTEAFQVGPDPTRVGTVPANWRTSRPHRPRLPTPRLYGRGDPPIAGRDDIRDRLWRHLRETLESGEPRRIELVGPHGSGRRSLVRWLAERAAELAGGWSHFVETAPTVVPAVLDCGGLPVEVVSPWLQGPVLAVWTRKVASPVPVVDRIVLPPLHPLSLATAVLERAPLDVPSVARVCAATETLQRPGIAMARLDAAVRDAWIAAAGGQLRTQPEVRVSHASVRAWWRDALDADADGPTREALLAAAVLETFERADLVALTGDPDAARRVSDWSFGSAPRHLPRALRDTLLDGREEEVRALRARAAEVLASPEQRAIHRAWVWDPTEVLPDLLAATARRRWTQDAWSPAVIEATERAMLAALVGDDDPRWAPVQLLRIAESRRAHGSNRTHGTNLEEHIERWSTTAPRWACIAAIKRTNFAVRTSGADAEAWIERARGLVHGDRELELAHRACETFLRVARGDVERATALSAGWRDVEPDADTEFAWASLVEAHAQTLPTAEMRALLESVLDRASGDGGGILRITLSAACGRLGAFGACVRYAREAADRLSPAERVTALTNLLLALVALDRREAAQLVAAEGVATAASVSPELIGLFHRAVFSTTTQWPDRGWEQAWALLPECSDPDAVPILERGVRWAHLDGRPDRAAVLEAEAARIAGGGDSG
ncbi:MAG: serine/threonine protein kinase [Alphaproteobacteria bacterium]|nr:serine/threonine protein kinase [Alphaproteobacteria bacterium]